ncbi:hypothetical protein ABZ746_23635 [Streptomyces sp. NPDC020096]
MDASGVDMAVPHLSGALRPGDYVQIAAERTAVDGVPDGEGHARVEWVEIIAEPGFLDPDFTFTASRLAREVAVVFCHGVPGPVMLRKGDQWTLGEVDADRVRWDEEHPWWPTEHELLFTGSRLAAGPHATRSTIEGPTLIESAPRPDGLEQPQGRRAVVFSKPASALMVGDYLQIHAVRYPREDMRIDEGFHRVEWIGHLAGEALGALLTDPAWACGRLTLASVHGLSGMLVLPESPVTVLAQPNVERRRWDEDAAWHAGPFYELAGATEPDLAQQRRVDAALRPRPTPAEAELYPSQFDSPEERALHLDGVECIRPVAACQLPWPHGLFKCPYGPRAKRLAATYPKGNSQTAHAELFAQLRPQDFAACPYHQADDWAAIAKAVLAHARAEREGDDERADQLYDAAHLTERDRAWFRSLISGHIWWDTGQKHLTNGQHRLCALRAAGVDVVPVYGRHLPDRDETEPAIEASTHARRTIEDFWHARAAELLGPGTRGTLLVRLLIRYPWLRVLLPKGE